MPWFLTRVRIYGLYGIHFIFQAIEKITTDTTYGARSARQGETMEDKVEAILTEARKVVRLKLGCTYDYVLHTMLVVESKVVQFSSR